MSGLYIQKDGTADIKSAFCGSTLPLRVEIGCGKGDFICGISVSEPDFSYVAVERESNVILLASEKYAKSRGLGYLDPHGNWTRPGKDPEDGDLIPAEEAGNVRFLNCDALMAAERFPDGSVESLYLNFSDPWPKKGYEKRRLTSEIYLPEYRRILKKGGFIKLKTDNDILYGYSLESLEKAGFRIAEHTGDLPEDDYFGHRNIVTEYENSFRQQGIKIKAIMAELI